MIDRPGLAPWRQQQLRLAQQADSSGAQAYQPRPAIVHLVARSSQFSGVDDIAATGELCNPSMSNGLSELPLHGRRFKG